MNNLQIAEVCYEVNRAYCLSLGDDSEPSWKDAGEWRKLTVIAGVDYCIANSDSCPSDLHQEWVRIKVKQGWKYGGTKDVELKQHPCMVLFSSLPPEQQAKDFILHAIIRQLVKS